MLQPWRSRDDCSPLASRPIDSHGNEVRRALRRGRPAATNRVRVVDLPFGNRPFRVDVDPSQDGAEVVNGVADRMRREMYGNFGLENLLRPAVAS